MAPRAMNIAPDYQTPSRMAEKLKAIPLPEFTGKRVFDVGCDFGFFCSLAAQRGATDVLGVDRNRVVRGVGHVDLVARNRAHALASDAPCRFEEIEVGKQWKVFGRFDVILVMSSYHHIFELCGDHKAIWFWLWRHCTVRTEIIWEGPVDDSDPVVRMNVSDANRPGYSREAILAAASWFFAAEYIGPALHEPTRQVWRFRPHPVNWAEHRGTIEAGAGGATRAFEYADGRRMAEIERVLGWRPVPGSLNVKLDTPFGWNDGYVRAQLLDVKDRSRGLESEWAPRWARFYPVHIDGEDAEAFRFEGERYDERFVELIAPDRLRDIVKGPEVCLSR